MERYSLAGYVAKLNQLAQISLLNGKDGTSVGLDTGSSQATSSTLVGAHAGSALHADSSDVVLVGARAGQHIRTAAQVVAIGTEAAHDTQVIKRSVLVGTRAGARIRSADLVTAVGHDAAAYMVAGQRNTMIGSRAGAYALDSSDNTFVGDMAGALCRSGAQNVCVGSGSGLGVEQGTLNTLVGYQAGGNVRQSSLNTMVGARTGIGATANACVLVGASTGLVCNVSGTVAVGTEAAYQSVGNENVFIGTQSASQFTGSKNTIIGHASGANARSNLSVMIGNDAAHSFRGDENVCLGANVATLGNGARNVVVGSQACRQLVGSNNVIVGSNIFKDANVPFNVDNSIVVGYSMDADYSRTRVANTVIIGTSGTAVSSNDTESLVLAAPSVGTIVKAKGARVTLGAPLITEVPLNLYGPSTASVAQTYTGVYTTHERYYNGPVTNTSGSNGFYYPVTPATGSTNAFHKNNVQPLFFFVTIQGVAYNAVIVRSRGVLTFVYLPGDPALGFLDATTRVVDTGYGPSISFDQDLYDGFTTAFNSYTFLSTSNGTDEYHQVFPGVAAPGKMVFRFENLWTAKEDNSPSKIVRESSQIALEITVFESSAGVDSTFRVAFTPSSSWFRKTINITGMDNSVLHAHEFNQATGNIVYFRPNTAFTTTYSSWKASAYFSAGFQPIVVPLQPPTVQIYKEGIISVPLRVPLRLMYNTFTSVALNFDRSLVLASEAASRKLVISLGGAGSRLVGVYTKAYEDMTPWYSTYTFQRDYPAYPLTVIRLELVNPTTNTVFAAELVFDETSITISYPDIAQNYISPDMFLSLFDTTTLPRTPLRSYQVQTSNKVYSFPGAGLTLSNGCVISTDDQRLLRLGGVAMTPSFSSLVCNYRSMSNVLLGGVGDTPFIDFGNDNYTSVHSIFHQSVSEKPQAKIIMGTLTIGLWNLTQTQPQYTQAGFVRLYVFKTPVSVQTSVLEVQKYRFDDVTITSNATCVFVNTTPAIAVSTPGGTSIAHPLFAWQFDGFVNSSFWRV
jgi:hypothetical protein